MTLYLWHMTAMLGLVGLSLALGARDGGLAIPAGGVELGRMQRQRRGEVLAEAIDNAGGVEG